MKLDTPITVTLTDARIGRINVNPNANEVAVEVALSDAAGNTAVSALLHLRNGESGAWRGKMISDLPTPTGATDALSALSAGADALLTHLVTNEYVAGRKQDDIDRETARAAVVETERERAARGEL